VDLSIEVGWQDNDKVTLHVNCWKTVQSVVGKLTLGNLDCVRRLFVGHCKVRFLEV